MLVFVCVRACVRVCVIFLFSCSVCYLFICISLLFGGIKVEIKHRLYSIMHQHYKTTSVFLVEVCSAKYLYMKSLNPDFTRNVYDGNI